VVPALFAMLGRMRKSLSFRSTAAAKAAKPATTFKHLIVEANGLSGVPGNWNVRCLRFCSGPVPKAARGTAALNTLRHVALVLCKSMSRACANCPMAQNLVCRSSTST
jgi:hypothetical protein